MPRYSTFWTIQKEHVHNKAIVPKNINQVQLFHETLISDVESETAANSRTQ